MDWDFTASVLGLLSFVILLFIGSGRMQPLWIGRMLLKKYLSFSSRLTISFIYLQFWSPIFWIERRPATVNSLQFFVLEAIVFAIIYLAPIYFLAYFWLGFHENEK